MADTLKLWEQIKAGMYDVYSSYLMMEEINKCSDEKLTMLYKYLSEITLTMIETINAEADYIANEIIRMGILTERRIDDCTHIGLAVVRECDIIVSWNFNHMVNVNTINGVRGINVMNGYRMIDIYSPTMLLKGSE